MFLLNPLYKEGMNNKVKWTYHNISEYVNYLFKMKHQPSCLSTNSSVSKDVCDYLNSVDINGGHNPDSLISHIFKHKPSGDFISVNMKGNGKNINAFFQNPDKWVGFNGDNFKKGWLDFLISIRKKEQKEHILLSYDNRLSLVRNIENLCTEHNLLEVEVYALLYIYGKLDFEKNTIIVKQEVTEKIKESAKENMTKIDTLRKEIGKAFNHSGDEYNLHFMTDGTGTGKTHNAVMNFLDSYPNNHCNVLTNPVKRRNLIFIAPQKNQFFLNEKVFHLASKQNIPLLFPRPSTDFLDLNGKSYFNYIDGMKKFETVKDFFDKLFSLKSQDRAFITNEIKQLYIARAEKKKKIKKNENDNSFLEPSKIQNGELHSNEKIPSLDLLISNYNSYANFESLHENEKKYNPEGYKEDFERIQSSFGKSLKELGNFFAYSIDDSILEQIFQNGSIYGNFNNFTELFKKKAVVYEFVYKLLMYTLPFEVAKYINSIIYLSGDKSKTLLYISEYSSNHPDIKVVRGYDLEDMVSGYKISQDANILNAYRNTDEFSNFLSNEYFIRNEANYFLNKGIGFSIVEDEEHVLYNKFIDKYTFKNITEDGYGGKKLNIIHALAGIDRWIKNSNISRRNVMNFNKIFEDKQRIIRNLFKTLKEHTVLKTDQEIENFFDMLSPNDFGVFAKTSDIDFIRTVCENIVSFSPKLIMLKEYLEQIKMVLNKGEDSLLIAKDISGCTDGSVYFNVYDFFQILLSVLFVCRDCSPALKSLMYEESESSHQNLALYYLLNLSASNKGFLTNLFSSSIDLKAEDPLNVQFSYFLTKIGFNFIFPDFIEKKDFDENFIRIEPKIFIIKELPEVGLLQMLKNKENKVFLLSATRGFQGIFSGNYSERFFNDMNKYIPGEIRIFKRENQDNNLMTEFINERFETRNSVEVVKMTIDEKTSMVNSVSYPVKSIELAELSSPKGIASTNQSYSLINPIQGKNYLSSIMSLAKKTEIFSSLWHPYHKSEITGILNSIIHAFEKNEHSIVMTLSNRFKKFLDDELFMNTVFKGYKPLCSDENKNKIFEFSPLSNNPEKKLRIIFFNSELGKMANLQEYFKVDKDTVVALVSSYGSAGTGLNLTLEDENGNEFDFSSIYFVSSPFYTNVMSDNGFSSMSNQLLIYKYFSHIDGKTIKDLSEGLASKEIKSILYKEHIMEKVKTLMQSSGRIERRDFNMDTKIYFVENGINSMFDETMSQFNQMFKIHSYQCEKTVVANFSMLNKALLKVAVNYIAEKSLPIHVRNNLEKESKAQYDIFNHFFTSKFGFLLNKYRELDPDYDWVADFNSIFRNYRTPQYNLKEKLKSFIEANLNILKKTNYYSDIVSLYKASIMDLESLGLKPEQKLTVDFMNYKYTDFSNSQTILSDKYFFDYGSDIRNGDIAEDEAILKELFKNTFSDSTLTYLPNLYMTHIIRGNLGEFSLEEYFKKNKILFNNIDSLFGDDVARKIYEIFDFYVVDNKNKTIYAIDTKNWNLYNDNGAIKTLERVDSKINKIKSIQCFSGYKIKFIYLNMFPNLNSTFTNGLTYHLSGFKDVEYINFIVKEYLYSKAKVNGKITSAFKKSGEILKINKQWKDII